MNANEEFRDELKRHLIRKATPYVVLSSREKESNFNYI